MGPLNLLNLTSAAISEALQYTPDFDIPLKIFEIFLTFSTASAALCFSTL
jgi:hypothetical protein